MDLTLVEWRADINLEELSANTVLVVLQELKYDFVEENIANRLRKGEYRNEYYIQEIVKELRSTAMFSHCRFMSQECQLSTFLFAAPLPPK